MLVCAYVCLCLRVCVCACVRVCVFYQYNNSAAALSEYRRNRGIRRDSLSVPGLKNIIRRFELTGDLGIAPGETDGQLRQKLLKKLLLPWLRMLDAMCNLHNFNNFGAIANRLYE